MKRSLRIAVELVAPPLVAVALGLLALEVEGPALTRADLRALPSLVGLAYVVGGLPSLVFAVAMEAAYARWFEPRSWLGVVLAAGLGGFGGLAVNLILRNGGDPALLRGLVLLGAVTGALVALGILAAERLGGGHRGGLPPLRLELR